jgi:hypothetical protein
VSGANDRSPYIAAQGPQENTIDDFWRMMLQTKATVILMLCQLTENQRVRCPVFEKHNHLQNKCEQYWPRKGLPLHIEKCGLTLTSICEEAVSEHLIRRNFQAVVTNEQNEIVSDYVCATRMPCVASACFTDHSPLPVHRVARLRPPGEGRAVDRTSRGGTQCAPHQCTHCGAL